MMASGELKKYILENNKVPEILKAIGCHHIAAHNGYYSCANPDGDNPVAIIVKLNQSLSVRDYTRENSFPDSIDIFTLIQYGLGLQSKPNTFHDAIVFLHNLFGIAIINRQWQGKTENQDEQDPLFWFKKIRSNMDYSEKVVVPKSIKEEACLPYPHISFVREGIMPWTWEKFGLGYSTTRKRTIIPLRFWEDGRLIGYNARTSIDNPDLFGIKKYLITPSYPKSSNLYGLWEHKEAIQKAGYVVVYEAEKSVLKRDSLFDETGVAVQGHSLSNTQIKILIGLNVEIVIAFDKDIGIEYIRHCCEKFYYLRKVSYIYDAGNLLGEKDSPVDKGDHVFKTLFNQRKTYDVYDHLAYQNSLNKGMQN